MEWNRNEWQGKTKEQVESSYIGVVIAIIASLVTAILLLV